MEGIKEVIYKSRKKADRGILKETAQGWSVHNVDRREKKRSCLTWVFFGIFALLGKKPYEWQVIYLKEEG